MTTRPLRYSTKPQEGGDTMKPKSKKTKPKKAKTTY